MQNLYRLPKVIVESVVFLLNYLNNISKKLKMKRKERKLNKIRTEKYDNERVRMLEKKNDDINVITKRDTRLSQISRQIIEDR